MSGQPYMPLFFGDVLASTAQWDGEQRALYVILLAYQWSSGPLPRDPKKIAQMAQYTWKSFAACWQVVGARFSDTDQGLVNFELEELRVKAKNISEKRAKAGSNGGKTTQAKIKQTSKHLLEQNGKQTGKQMLEVLPGGLLCHPNQTKPREEAYQAEEVSEWNS